VEDEAEKVAVFELLDKIVEAPDGVPRLEHLLDFPS